MPDSAARMAEAALARCGVPSDIPPRLSMQWHAHPAANTGTSCLQYGTMAAVCPVQAMTDQEPPRLARAIPDFVVVPALIGGMLLLLVTLPVTLPVAAWLNGRDRRRLRAAADRTRCVRCGLILGTKALEASDAAHRAALADAQRRHPGHRIRFVRRSHARCVSCGTDYVWDEKGRTLNLLPMQVDMGTTALADLEHGTGGT